MHACASLSCGSMESPILSTESIMVLTIPEVVVRLPSFVSSRKALTLIARVDSSTLSLWSTVQVKPGASILHQKLGYPPVVRNKYCGMWKLLW